MSHVVQGIALSGGQKQRVNICRALYCDTDIQIFDVRTTRLSDSTALMLSFQDPLSALDAHVGKAVFQNVLRNNSSGKTRILVTHALHFLPQVDYIFTVVDGRIAERGTHTALMSTDGEFARMFSEFGSNELAEAEGSGTEEASSDSVEKKPIIQGKGMMQVEERNKGAVAGRVYRAYLRAAKGVVTVPLIILSLLVLQGTTVMSSYWYVITSFIAGVFNIHQAHLLARNEMASTAALLREPYGRLLS